MGNDEVYNGRWGQSLRKKETLVGDMGVEVLDEARKHAIAAGFEGDVFEQFCVVLKFLIAFFLLKNSKTLQ